MFFNKNKENLSVEILDVDIDISKIPSIKSVKLVYINGKNKLTIDKGETEAPDYVYPCHIKLNDIPLIQAKVPDCPTCCSLLATGYGIENANCEELLEIQEKINSNYISLENCIDNISPLLKLFETGFYLIADAICYPTDGDKNFFWNIPNNLTEFLTTAPVLFTDEGEYIGDILSQPVYLYPTQTTNCYNKKRVDYYIDKFKNSKNADEPRAIVYNFSDFLNFIIDGHHKACASALLGKALKCTLIIKGQCFTDFTSPKSKKLYFSSIVLDSNVLPKKYLSLLKEEKYPHNFNKIKLDKGIVSNRIWEKEYLDSVNKYIPLKEYATIMSIIGDDEIKITDDTIKYCLKNFDEDSQLKIEKIILLLNFTDTIRAEKLALEYAQNSFKYEINKRLKILIYRILSTLKENEEVEKIFVDYLVYCEDKDDPVLEIINSYWGN